MKPVYDKMMSLSPIIEKDYLFKILDLHDSQMIDNIEVSGITESNTSLTYKIAVSIEDKTEKYLKKLFVKTIKVNDEPDVYRKLSLKEVQFHRFVQSLQTKKINEDFPVVKCFDSYISDDQKFILFMEDISDTYSVANEINLRKKEMWHMAAASMAKFHAAFWNSELIGSKEKPVDDINKINGYISDTYEAYDKFIKELKSRNCLDDETRDIYGHALETMVSLHNERYGRLQNRNNVTVLHGDSHIYNFMLPVGDSEMTENHLPKIIDFQFWGFGLAGEDLAHLTRLSFPLDKEMHKSVILRYYETLMTNGVRDFSWEDCWNDYRRYVVSMLFIPIWQFSSFNLKYEDWIGEVKSTVDNYKILECRSLEV